MLKTVKEYVTERHPDTLIDLLVDVKPYEVKSLFYLLCKNLNIKPSQKRQSQFYKDVTTFKTVLSKSHLLSDMSRALNYIRLTKDSLLNGIVEEASEYFNDKNVKEEHSMKRKLKANVGLRLMCKVDKKEAIRARKKIIEESQVIKLKGIKFYEHPENPGILYNDRNLEAYRTLDIDEITKVSELPGLIHTTMGEALMWRKLPYLKCSILKIDNFLLSLFSEITQSEEWLF